MKRLKAARLGIVAAGCAFAALSAQAVTITVDKVQQRWPWNNKVDVTYTITDTDTILDSNNAKVVFTTVVNGNTYTFETGPNEKVWNGTHTFTWEGAPSGVKSANCKMSAAYYTEAVPQGNDYMIVELSTGVVKYEGLGSDSGRMFGSLTAQQVANSRYNNIKHYDSKMRRVMSKYKTSHMVMRKIPAGTYYTDDNNATEWTVPRDFYMQIFPYTNYQYWDVFGMVSIDARDYGQQDEKPRALKWADIRGDINPTTAPTSGTSDPKYVVRWLNGRTRGTLAGTFELPTFIMHEIACRAGTSGWYFWGSDDGSKYAVSGWPIVEVGTKLPNNWGFYDMVGLNWQWCLDVLNGSRAEGHENDPFAPLLGDNSQRIVRGGDCGTAIQHMYSDKRGDANPGSNEYAFRLAYIVPAE